MYLPHCPFSLALNTAQAPLLTAVNDVLTPLPLFVGFEDSPGSLVDACDDAVAIRFEADEFPFDAQGKVGPGPEAHAGLGGNVH